GRLLARVAFDQDLERSRRVAEGRDRILIPARGHHAAVLVSQLLEQRPRCRLLDPALDLIADTVRIERLAGVDDAPEAAQRHATGRVERDLRDLPDVRAVIDRAGEAPTASLAEVRAQPLRSATRSITLRRRG